MSFNSLETVVRACVDGEWIEEREESTSNTPLGSLIGALHGFEEEHGGIDGIENGVVTEITATVKIAAERRET